MRSVTWGLMVGCAASALLSASAETPNWPGPQPLNTYGHTGLLEMPSARVMEDGEFAVTVASGPESFRTTLTFQVFPWLEAAFRYGRINNFFALSDPDDPDLLDRSFSLKVKLLSETEYLPAVAIGMNDIVGTGIYGGEYVVASKNWGDFDFTLGVGWGRMGSVGMFRNPFSLIDDRFDTRPTYDPNNDQGGKPLFNSIFRGRDVSLFGGVVWQTPVDGLKAIVEYSGDKYVVEDSLGLYHPESQWNFGLSYRYDSLLEGTLSYLYGDTISFRVSVRFDPTVETMKVMEPTPLPPAVRPAEQRPGGAVSRVEDVPVRSAEKIEAIGLRGVSHAASDDKWSLEEYARTGNALLAQNQGTGGGGSSMQEIMSSGRWNDVPAIRQQIIDSLKALGEAQSLGIEAVDLKKDYVAVYYNNTHYIRETDAIHRMLRVLTTLPPSVEHFYITSVVGGLPSTEVQMTRSAYERAVQQFAAVDDLVDYVKIAPGGMEIPDDAIRFADTYPRFSWEILPRPRTLLFDPDKPFRLGLTLSIGGSVEFEGGWRIEGNWTSDLIDTVDDPKPGNSVLPHVRTDFRLYRDQGQHGIESLLVSKIGKLAPDIFYEVRAGLLEDMYGGIGGEVIWRPEGSDIAWGANIYYLKQRDFDRLFEFRDYDVVTGQVSMYWQDAIWRGVNVNVHAGRYLAGDWGGTVEVTRKFESGVEIGAYATLTDVPFEEFGEGSFDKGLIIRVPFGWIAPFNTQYTVSTYLASLTRDGGQRLYDRNPLWEKVRRTNESEIRRTWKLDVTPGL